MHVVLPDPFGSDQAEHLARMQVERDAVQRAEAAEALDQAVDLQKRSRASTQGTRMPRLVSSDTRPLGRNSTSSTISAP